MSNIFENTYFGKPYKTRNDYKALFIRHYKDSESDDMYYLMVENAAVTYVYNKNGEIAPSYKNKGLDIVSEWDEEIDEKKLNKLAEESFYNEGWGVTDNPLDTYIDGYKNGWKQRMNRNESKTV